MCYAVEENINLIRTFPELEFIFTLGDAKWKIPSRLST